MSTFKKEMVCQQIQFIVFSSDLDTQLLYLICLQIEWSKAHFAQAHKEVCFLAF